VNVIVTGLQVSWSTQCNGLFKYKLIRGTGNSLGFMSCQEFFLALLRSDFGLEPFYLQSGIMHFRVKMEMSLQAKIPSLGFRVSCICNGIRFSKNAKSLI